MPVELDSKKTKIVCTIGPASESPDVLARMIHGGMNVARLNFAHGDFEAHGRMIRRIREAAERTGRRVAILGDLPGPKMRIGSLAEEPVELEAGDEFVLQTNEILGDRHRVSMSFEGLPRAVKPGDKIFVNDGFIQLEVVDARDKEVATRVQVGGELRSNKGVNFPGIDLGLRAFTPRDHELLRFAAEQGVDAVSQSFVQGAADVTAVREAAAALDYDPFLIAKIERAGAVEQIDEILEVVDGIMVARGDLGVEIPIERIAVTQKKLILAAGLRGRAVITATQMLESMVDHTRPTRAEATDVANAILDGTDCVMLSEETATGRNPAEVVAMMRRIAEETEPFTATAEPANVLQEARDRGEISLPDLMSLAMFLTARTIDPCAILIPTQEGETPRKISPLRLPVWVIALAFDEATCQALQFSYGVHPVCERAPPIDRPAYVRALLAGLGIEGRLALVARSTDQADAGFSSHLDILDLESDGTRG